MRTAFKTLLAATALAGAATFAAAPANADGFGLSIGPGGGVSFSVTTGGYCDRWGCPDDYWGYPVYYGPVFFGGQWYNGPLYYRYSGGSYWYWLHGGWRRDEWRGPRPGWWRNDYRYGPALGLDYYRDHGFHVRDRDWNRYRNDPHWNRGGGHNDWNHGRDNDHGDNRFNGGNNDHHDWNRGGGNDHGDRNRFNGGADVRQDQRPARNEAPQGSATPAIQHDRAPTQGDRQGTHHDRNNDSNNDHGHHH